VVIVEHFRTLATRRNFLGMCIEIKSGKDMGPEFPDM